MAAAGAPGVVEKYPDFFTVAGHQCQFGVDFAKPTPLLSNIKTMRAFGKAGWPTMSHWENYQGPLPHCGHVHKGQSTGLTSSVFFGD